MTKKIRVGILFGGKSAEHEVSLQSAKNIIEAIDKDKYDVTPIAIDKSGKWYVGDAQKLALHAPDVEHAVLDVSSEQLSIVPGQSQHQLISASATAPIDSLDVVFPVLHGPMGEDGTVQGMLKLLNIPFVGADVLGSAVGMDKDMMKRLLAASGVPVAKFVVINQARATEFTYDQLAEELGKTFFLKSANMGSSIGVYKVRNAEDFQQALDGAFEYDTKIVCEEFIRGHEIECSVLGNEHKKASVPGEIIVNADFYSYEAKYIDEDGAALVIPAENLSLQAIQRIQELAIKACEVLCCDGMARVDFFVTKNEEIYVNEINTIPGFTRTSMYPKLWEASGLPSSELIDQLIQLAMERHERLSRLKTVR